ncbi:MAG: hypothetical protein QXF26_03250, partial [Candidatus Bathyarchaeia archaeon]
AAYAGNITLLDFSDYSQPIESWNKSFSLIGKTTSWSLAPEPLNLTVTFYADNSTWRYFAFMEHDMMVYAPGLAEASDDTIIIRLGQKNYETVFALIIAATFALSIVFYAWERGARKGVIKRKR